MFLNLKIYKNDRLYKLYVGNFYIYIFSNIFNFKFNKCCLI